MGLDQFNSKPKPLHNWINEHLGWMLLAALLLVYLLFAWVKQYGSESIGKVILFLLLTYIFPNFDKLKHIGHLDMQAFIESLKWWIFVMVCVLGLFFLAYLLVGLYPQPYSFYTEGAATIAGVVVLFWFRKKLLFSWTICFAVGVLCFWLTASLGDWLFLKFRAPDLPVVIEESSKDAPPLKVGLALSGGGYRAAVMHAGVLSALEEVGIKPTHLATVSGGSIIGAYYAAGGTPKRFRQLMERKLFNLKREMWGFPNPIKIMAPSKLPFSDFKLYPWHSFSRADVQRKVLEKLLIGDSVFAQLPT